jgi:hypothetical protein
MKKTETIRPLFLAAIPVGAFVLVWHEAGVFPALIGTPILLLAAWVMIGAPKID